MPKAIIVMSSLIVRMCKVIIVTSSIYPHILSGISLVDCLLLRNHSCCFYIKMGDSQPSCIIQTLARSYAFSMQKDFGRILKRSCFGCRTELKVSLMCISHSVRCFIIVCISIKQTNSYLSFKLQNPLDHLCVTFTPLQQIEHCFYDLESCVNESEVQDFFDVLMTYMHPEIHQPSKLNHFHYRKTLLSDRGGQLYKNVVRELINLID